MSAIKKQIKKRVYKKKNYKLITDLWGTSLEWNEWEDIFRAEGPRIINLQESAVLNAGIGADQQKILREIWKILPRRISDLSTLATTAARIDNRINPSIKEIRYMINLKIACLLTQPNRWHMSLPAWKISQEIQQIWPVWKAGVAREFRFTFKKCLTPSKKAYNMTLINDNIFSEMGIKSLHIIAKHKQNLKKNTDSLTLTEWHVHGILWPGEGPSMSKDSFRYHFNKLKAALKKGRKKNQYRYDIIETHFDSVRDLPCLASYLARNYYEAVKYRNHVRNEAKGSNCPVPPDAGEDVRLYAPPSKKWDNHEWSSWKHTQQVTPYTQAYRRATGDVAWDKDIFRHDRDCKFDEDDRREIFKRACENVPDLPYNPSIMGRDGYVYQIQPVYQPWWGTLMFECRRKLTTLDYTLNRQTVPEIMGEIVYQLSIYQLYRLGQAEVGPDAMPSTTKIECLITGRRHAPNWGINKWPVHILDAMAQDSRVEGKWMNNSKRPRGKDRMKKQLTEKPKNSTQKHL